MDMDKYIYKYRGEVEIPPLSMVDDVLCISECGFKTTMSNAYLTLTLSLTGGGLGGPPLAELAIAPKCIYISI